MRSGASRQRTNTHAYIGDVDEVLKTTSRSLRLNIAAEVLSVATVGIHNSTSLLTVRFTTHHILVDPVTFEQTPHLRPPHS